MDMDTIDADRLHKALILVVDDMELNRKVLTHSLAARGYHNVVTANEGSQALQITNDMKPDLVILDMMMPEMDGFAYCKAVRQNKAFDNMPIIVQTALEEMNQKLRAFQLGASDYLCKPIDPGELIARTQVHLSQKLLMEDLRAYRARTNAELAAARNMQNRLMPSAHNVEVCERVYNMKIGSYFETSSILGGDCWGMRPLSDNRLAIYMYDFSGHGVTAAMNVFRMHTVMQESISGGGGDPGSFLTILNRQLHPLLERDEFATMFYGVIDTDANCLLYSCAAVPPIILFTRNENSPIMLNGRGFPIGVVPNATYETKFVPFTHTDMLLVFSDGLIEAKNSSGAFMSEDDIKNNAEALLATKPKNPATATIEGLVKSLKAHSGKVIEDDITINTFWRCPKDGR